MLEVESICRDVNEFRVTDFNNWCGEWWCLLKRRRLHSEGTEFSLEFEISKDYLHGHR